MSIQFDKPQPAIFFGHGSPGNVMEDNAFTRCWQQLGKEFEKPQAIICVSAHWFTNGVYVSSAGHPPTIHDFGGFPKNMYELQYPAPGSPKLAQEICERLSSASVRADAERGFDHGNWCVLSKAYPEADIPIVQLSMDADMLPSQHYEIGSLLSSFRDEGVMLVGSGNIVHNLTVMDWNMRNGSYPWAARFGDYIRDSIANDEPSHLIDYAQFGEDAALSVPSPDHYLPLLYVMGARRPGETVRIETPVMEYGSIDMTSIIVGP